MIDTGVDFSHPDLQATQWVNSGEDCAGCRTNGVDDHGHGTHVAGTIGATGNDGVGVAGVAWNGVKIMALKFLSAGDSGSTADAVQAVLDATASGAQVTNNSWGGGGGFSQALYDAVSAAGHAGSLFVAAAGNDAESTDDWAHYPSSYDLASVVSVAATESNDALAYFSNYGARTVDLGAPGRYVYSTIPGGGYGFKSGTSMATPHVAGAVAAIRAAHPGAQALGLKALLLGTVDPTPALAGGTVSGGRLNLASPPARADRQAARRTRASGRAPPEQRAARARRSRSARRRRMPRSSAHLTSPPSRRACHRRRTRRSSTAPTRSASGPSTRRAYPTRRRRRERG